MNYKWRFPTVGQIVVVEWLDVFGDSTWLNKEEQTAFHPAKARSVGIVVSCDEETLKLAHNVLWEEGQSDVTAYPIGMIQNVRVLVCQP